jgi:hypothetical protein
MVPSASQDEKPTNSLGRPRSFHRDRCPPYISTIPSKLVLTHDLEYSSSFNRKYLDFLPTRENGPQPLLGHAVAAHLRHFLEITTSQLSIAV